MTMECLGDLNVLRTPVFSFIWPSFPFLPCYLLLCRFMLLKIHNSHTFPRYLPVPISVTPFAPVPELSTVCKSTRFSNSSKRTVIGSEHCFERSGLAAKKGRFSESSSKSGPEVGEGGKLVGRKALLLLCILEYARSGCYTPAIVTMVVFTGTPRIRAFLFWSSSFLTFPCCGTWPRWSLATVASDGL